MNTAVIHVRIDEDLKRKATEALESMGLSVSDATRIFLKRVVADQGLPFDLRVPNATTRAAMAEADDILRQNKLRFSGVDSLEDMFSDITKRP